MDPQSIDRYRSHLDEVVRRGRAVRALLAERPGEPSAAAAARIWQHDSEATIAQLSGGRKTHWLSRAYNDALLVRAEDGGALDRVDVAVIVDRLLAVLDRAIESLDRFPAVVDSPSTAEAAVHRFDFVHDRDLRPVLEEAYEESRRALDERRFDEALVSSCGILEAIITDALVHQDPAGRADLVSRSFEERIAAAERQGLIRKGCARLPPVARAYRESMGAGPAIIDAREGEARTTAQVLRIVMRDLDPGR